MCCVLLRCTRVCVGGVRFIRPGRPRSKARPALSCLQLRHLTASSATPSIAVPTTVVPWRGTPLAASPGASAPSCRVINSSCGRVTSCSPPARPDPARRPPAAALDPTSCCSASVLPSIETVMRLRALSRAAVAASTAQPAPAAAAASEAVWEGRGLKWRTSSDVGWVMRPTTGNTHMHTQAVVHGHTHTPVASAWVTACTGMPGDVHNRVLGCTRTHSRQRSSCTQRPLWSMHAPTSAAFCAAMALHHRSSRPSAV